MTKSAQVDLELSHNLACCVATGVAPSDAQRLVVRTTRWEDWYCVWSEEAGRHKALAKQARTSARRQRRGSLVCTP
jgi:hypothetical protein